MSRIGKKIIEIPEGIEVKLDENKIVVKGQKGELSQKICPEIRVEVKNKEISVLPREGTLKHSKKSGNTGETKKTKALWGLTRTLIANMIKGVSDGYEKKLEIQGLGYRASLEGENLALQIGFSHPVKLIPPLGIKFSIEKNIITVSGFDKELVGQIAAKIRKIRPPEPYKGKGIRYLGELVRKKAGKRAATTK